MSKMQENLDAVSCSTAVLMQGLSRNILHVSFAVASCSNVCSVELGPLSGSRHIRNSVVLEAFIGSETRCV